MAELAPKWGGCRLKQLCCFCRCTERSIHLYSTGRKPLPRVEQNLAEAFGITVAQLRRELNLDNQEERS